MPVIDTHTVVEINDEIPKKRRRAKTRFKRSFNADSCTWREYICNPDLEHDPLFNRDLLDPDSRASKLFRSRFRVPWEFFNSVLLPQVLEWYSNVGDIFGKYIHLSLSFWPRREFLAVSYTLMT